MNMKLKQNMECTEIYLKQLQKITCDIKSIENKFEIVLQKFELMAAEYDKRLLTQIQNINELERRISYLEGQFKYSGQPYSTIGQTVY